MSRPRIGSLFSGYGGLDMAVEQVLGATPAWFSEIDPAPVRILAHHHPEVPNHGDITVIDWADVEPVDVITGGYPCQPFSSAGHRRGEADERHLWPFVHEAIRYLRPSHVFLENVAGHRSMGFGRVLGDLASIGYDARWTSLRASDVGAPHHRERVFIASHPQGIGGQERDKECITTTASEGRDWMGDSPGDLGGHLRRWGGILGRPSPQPLRSAGFTGNAANPGFWEWLMGLPEGYVTQVPSLTHGEQLTALGNGVVPQQAAAAIRHLLDWIEGAA